MTKSERSTYTALDFQEWAEQGSLIISPKFQRRPVWRRPAQSFLIDTMLLQMPVPPIYLRLVQDESRKKIIREVIDGQQRISAVLEYLKGAYALGKNIESSDCIGRRFSDLTDEQKDRVAQYPFICEVFYGIEDDEVLRIFARLNTNSVRLNAQELRNGQYFGEFKQSAYNLALEHLSFWRHHRVFTEMRIARMMEVELTSELMILQMVGLQDKKKGINNFYEQYDEDFKKRGTVESRFRRITDAINEACFENLASTEFRRPPLFYSLFGAVCHRMYGVPGIDLNTPAKGKLNSAEIEGLSDAIVELSDYVIREKDGEEVPRQFEPFVAACLRQTDNIRPRTTRMITIYNRAFS